MKKLLEYCFMTMLTVVWGCSPPIGDVKPPTPADIVHYSHHVVVGTVTEIIRPDPMTGTMYGDTSAYGAKVQVRCTYKGPVLGDSITIGGAGFIPGLCVAKDLEPNTKYILFLREVSPDGYYEQSEPAEPYNKIMEFLNVCGLQMEYPKENGMTLKRQVCPPVSALPGCLAHTEAPITKQTAVNVKAAETNEETGSQGGGQTGQSTGEGDNGGMVVGASLLLSLISLFSIRYM